MKTPHIYESGTANNDLKSWIVEVELMKGAPAGKVHVRAFCRGAFADNVEVACGTEVQLFEVRHRNRTLDFKSVHYGNVLIWTPERSLLTVWQGRWEMDDVGVEKMREIEITMACTTTWSFLVYAWNGTAARPNYPESMGGPGSVADAPLRNIGMIACRDTGHSISICIEFGQDLNLIVSSKGELDVGTHPGLIKRVHWRRRG
ncbi:hypothetical protein DFH07DRAFT_785253 [Mycena maculata]|uniref:Uncharacterized protein n=1 Tax=Mycena maculata TaxID=230809 RepID=A0AAD7HC59_9AGAR|nr:hypothetical protein DFH07DRAFT_785253 [Mycena maculata]